MCTPFRWLTLAALLVVVLGCSRGPVVVPVTGKVMMNGKPLKNVKVDFHPDSESGHSGPSSSGTTDEEGNFALTCVDGEASGAVVGKHRVVVTDLDTFGTAFVGRGDYRADDDQGKPTEVPKQARFAAGNSDIVTTTLTQDVKEGMGPVTIEVQP